MNYSDKKNTLKQLKIVFSSIVIVVFLSYIYFFFDFSEIYQIIANSSLKDAIIPVVFYYVFFVLFRFFRWNKILSKYGYSGKKIDILIVLFIAIGISNYTPAQIGEIMKVESVILENGYGREKIYQLFFLEKILDLIIILTVCLISIIIPGSKLANYWIEVGSYQFLILCFLCFFVFFSALIVYFWKRFFFEFSKVDGLIFCIQSFISWIFITMSWKVIFQSFNISINILDLLAIVCWSSVIKIVSLVPGGLGITEVAISEIIQVFGYSASISQSAALSLHLISVVGIFISLIFYLFYFCRKILNKIS